MPIPKKNPWTSFEDSEMFRKEIFDRERDKILRALCVVEPLHNMTGRVKVPLGISKCRVDEYNKKIFEGLGIPKDLLYGNSPSPLVGSPSSFDMVDAIVASMSSTRGVPKRAGLFSPNNQAVLRGRIRRKTGMIQKLKVDDEGVSYIKVRIGSGFDPGLSVGIAENFVGELYYKFTLDGEDLFGGRV